MKKFPKIVQADARGQIVIPKDVRRDLGIDEGTGFYMYTITDEGLLLKKIKPQELGDQKKILDEIDEKADILGIKRSNVRKSVRNYKKTQEGNLEVL